MDGAFTYAVYELGLETFGAEVGVSSNTLGSQSCAQHGVQPTRPAAKVEHPF